MSLFVRIYSRYHVVFEGEADFASIPTRMGEVGILENHIRMYSKLENGIIRLRNSSNEQEFTCTGGIMEVLPKEIRILVDSAENVEMIDEARAAEAVRRAETAMKEAREQKDDSEFARAYLLLKKSRLRVSAAKRRSALRSGFSGDHTGK